MNHKLSSNRVIMQTTSMPHCSLQQSLLELSTDDDLSPIAQRVWDMLLSELQARKPNCKKGPKSSTIQVTKGDILSVRHSSRKEFWRKAQECKNRGVLPVIGNSGSMLFWAALNTLMVGDHPRVRLEDNQILGRPNTHGDARHVLSMLGGMHGCHIVIHRLLHTFVATHVKTRAICAKGLPDFVLCLQPS